MDSLLLQFINEAKSLIQAANVSLMALEEDASDVEEINNVFRAIHTIKGTSGMLELNPVVTYLHALEDILDDIRRGKRQFSSEYTDIILNCLDRLGVWFEALEETGKLPKEAGERSEEFAEDLKTLCNEANRETKSAVAPSETFIAFNSIPETRDTTTETKDDLRDMLSKLGEVELVSLYKKARSGKAAFSFVIYKPDPECYFNGDDPFYSVKKIKKIAVCVIQPTEPAGPIQDFDVYKCALEFRFVCDLSEEEIKKNILVNSKELKIESIDFSDFIIPCGMEIPDGVNPDIESLEKAFKEKNNGELKKTMDSLLDSVADESREASALRWIALLLKNGEVNYDEINRLIKFLKVRTTPNPNPTLSCNGNSSQSSPISLTDDIVENLNLLESNLLNPQALERDAYLNILQSQLIVLVYSEQSQDLAVNNESVLSVLTKTFKYFNKKALEEQLKECSEGSNLAEQIDKTKKLIIEELNSLGISVSMPTPSQKLQLQKVVVPVKVSDSEPTPSTSSKDDKKSRTLNVDQYKIDKMMDLIGEMTVAKNSLPYYAKRAEEVYGLRDLGREMKELHNVVHRIVEELQSTIMEVRMVPVNQVFQRFPRLVRDIARKLSKQVKLVMEGEDTEIEKNVIDNLLDPMVHLLRNSIDHGIESPEKRIKNGKASDGLIRITASQENDRIIIELSDDGKGIDPSKIKESAFNKGLIDETKFNTISDQEALNLIFMPGFSTASSISEVSGRGVGMDAVRSAVERLGGSISVASVPGEGTTTKFALPLSRSVTRVMIVEASNEIYGIPLDIIRETVRINRADITAIKDKETIALRNRIIPLVRLDRLLDVDSDKSEDREEVALLIVRILNDDIGIIVDKFHDNIELALKPLQGVLANIRGYSGAGLLGDGRALLVLNVLDLIYGERIQNEH